MTQYPVAANHTIAPPTNRVNRLNHGVKARNKTEATEMLTPTAR